MSAEIRRGVASAYDRLAEQVDDVAHLTRRLAEARRLRDLLIVKLVTAGESTRQIGAVAHISSPGVSFIARRPK